MPKSFIWVEWVTVCLFVAMAFSWLQIFFWPRGRKHSQWRTLFCLCGGLGMLIWNGAAIYRSAYSPHATVTGQVTGLRSYKNLAGQISFRFKLDSADESSPSYYTGTAGEAKNGYPLDEGDMVKIETRVWDDGLVWKLDELNGGHPGWHLDKSRTTGLNWMMILVGLIWIGFGVWSYSKSRPRTSRQLGFPVNGTEMPDGQLGLR